MADTPDDCAGILMDLDRLEKWAEWNLMKFNHGKFFQLRRANPRHQYAVGLTGWKAAVQRRTSGSWWQTS